MTTDAAASVAIAEAVRCNAYDPISGPAPHDRTLCEIWRGGSRPRRRFKPGPCPLPSRVSERDVPEMRPHHRRVTHALQLLRGDIVGIGVPDLDRRHLLIEQGLQLRPDLFPRRGISGCGE